MICSIIVLYKANKNMVLSLYESLKEQVDKLIFVKNDNTNASFIQSLDKVVFIDLGDNYGIAYAQNRGIEEARKTDVDWVLFSDQDTCYPPHYISDLISISMNRKLENIGALCPVFYDEIKKSYGELTVEKTKTTKPEIGKIYELAHTISSGTLVPMNVLEKIGGMNENLFIDFVDNEWCWRVNEKGFKIYCITNVCIHHQLGDKMVRKLGIQIVSRSQMRFYYIIRNGYYLTTTNHLSRIEVLKYKIMLMKKGIEFLLLYGISIRNFLLIKKAKYNGLRKYFTPYEEI